MADAYRNHSPGRGLTSTERKHFIAAHLACLTKLGWTPEAEIERLRAIVDDWQPVVAGVDEMRPYQRMLEGRIAEQGAEVERLREALAELVALRDDPMTAPRKEARPEWETAWERARAALRGGE